MCVCVCLVDRRVLLYPLGKVCNRCVHAGCLPGTAGVRAKRHDADLPVQAALANHQRRTTEALARVLALATSAHPLAICGDPKNCPIIAPFSCCYKTGASTLHYLCTYRRTWASRGRPSDRTPWGMSPTASAVPPGTAAAANARSPWTVCPSRRLGCACRRPNSRDPDANRWVAQRLSDGKS